MDAKSVVNSLSLIEKFGYDSIMSVEISLCAYTKKSGAREVSNSPSMKVTVFCPRGCNVSEVTMSQDDSLEHTDECAACGSVMRPECREEFEGAHEPSDFSAYE